MLVSLWYHTGASFFGIWTKAIYIQFFPFLGLQERLLLPLNGNAVLHR